MHAAICFFLSGFTIASAIDSCRRTRYKDAYQYALLALLNFGVAFL